MARNALLAMSGKSVVRMNEGKDKLPAIDWCLEVIFKPAIADTRKVFRLESMELRSLFGAMEGRFGFISFDEITPQLEKIAKEAKQIAIHKEEGLNYEPVTSETSFTSTTALSCINVSRTPFNRKTPGTSGRSWMGTSVPFQARKI